MYFTPAWHCFPCTAFYLRSYVQVMSMDNYLDLVNKICVETVLLNLLGDIGY